MTDTFKQCWSCDARVPYEGGFCDTCLAVIPETLRPLAHDFTVPEPFGGAVRGGLVSAVRQVLRPPLRYERRVREAPTQKKRSINLSDIGL